MNPKPQSSGGEGPQGMEWEEPEERSEKLRQQPGPGRGWAAGQSPGGGVCRTEPTQAAGSVSHSFLREEI